MTYFQTNKNIKRLQNLNVLMKLKVNSNAIVRKQIKSIPYHSSLIFLVSGQAQHGFNFFSGSLELSCLLEVDSEEPIANLQIL